MKHTQCKKCLAWTNRGKDHVCDDFMLKIVDRERRKKSKIPKG
jgi:hypothetical protein